MENKSSYHYYDLILAHDFSSHHRRDLEKDSVCGCFYCLNIFNPEIITDWVDGDETALCPFCETDSVIGERSGFPITKEFLESMRRKWFDE